MGEDQYTISKLILNEFVNQISNRENKLLIENFSFLACEADNFDQEFLFCEYLRLCHWDGIEEKDDNGTNDEKKIKNTSK